MTLKFLPYAIEGASVRWMSNMGLKRGTGLDGGEEGSKVNFGLLMGGVS